MRINMTTEEFNKLGTALAPELLMQMIAQKSAIQIELHNQIT
jgi:hypothetical protein